ncbi:hypothetical protein jhhlp_005003 [Lomentospora prolificans]|uniref:Beta-lactamase-related domain-containing protein n=1 Tax=Lomentospora prolificans TaxID=41688 RepID=A0A2N3N837_9PEZI|nr:hypothetical protein jhhlp_005003 [Lomentospora prolificans]
MRTLAATTSVAAVLVPRGVIAQGSQAQVPMSPNPPAPDLDSSRGSPLTDDFKKYVDDLREEWHVPGISVGVVDGDETYTSGYGHARLDPDVEATPDTLYYIGSITKGMTSASLLYVLDSTANSSRPLSLDSKVHDLIPEDFVLSDDYATLHANVRDLLCHRLGYPRHDLSYGGPGFKAKDGVRLLRHLQMTKEFREEFQYFNIGYQVAQHIVETLTGKWIGDVFDEAIFGPLGMDSSTVELKVAENMSDRLAKGYAYNNATKESLDLQPWWDGDLVGPGGVISSVVDFTKYLRAMISQDLPFSKKLQDALVTPLIPGNTRVTPPNELSHELYALGWQITHYRGHRLIYHNGGTPGFTTMNGFLPEKKWGAVVFTNGDLGGSVSSEAAFYRLLDDFLGVEPENRHDASSKYVSYISKRQDRYLNARKTLFPDAPNPPLPHALPLEDYQGTYFNPGYRNIKLSLVNPADDFPIADKSKKILQAVIALEWEAVLDFEHVSGENFAFYLNLRARAPMLQEIGPAEFVIGSNGKVMRLGMQLEPSLEEKIWFDRLEV